jgi:hypothetical protein
VSLAHRRVLSHSNETLWHLLQPIFWHGFDAPYVSGFLQGYSQEPELFMLPQGNTIDYAPSDNWVSRLEDLPNARSSLSSPNEGNGQHTLQGSQGLCRATPKTVKWFQTNESGRNLGRYSSAKTLNGG